MLQSCLRNKTAFGLLSQRKRKIPAKIQNKLKNKFLRKLLLRYRNLNYVKFFIFIESYDYSYDSILNKLFLQISFHEWCFYLVAGFCKESVDDSNFDIMPLK